jgi:hypothetical protein
VAALAASIQCRFFAPLPRCRPSAGNTARRLKAR